MSSPNVRSRRDVRGLSPVNSALSLLGALCNLHSYLLQHSRTYPPHTVTFQDRDGLVRTLPYCHATLKLIYKSGLSARVRNYPNHYRILEGK